MVKALDAIGLHTRQLVLVVTVITLEHIMRRNAWATVARLLKDGRRKKQWNQNTMHLFFVHSAKHISADIFRYHVPRSWLNPTGNLLVVFEEWGGDPNGIQLVRREVDSVCAYMYEWQPTLVNWQMQASGRANKPLRPKAHLMCGPGQKIKSIKFASFGTPEGVCGNYRQGSCHAFHSYDAFQRVCSTQ